MSALNMAAIAELVGLSERRVRQIAEAARIVPEKRGQWPGPAVVQAVLDDARASRSTSPLAVAQERVAEARAREIEIRTAERRRELIPVEDAVAAMDAVVAAWVTPLEELPRRLFCDADGIRKAHEVIDECRTRAAANIADAAQACRDGEIIE